MKHPVYEDFELSFQEGMNAVTNNRMNFAQKLSDLMISETFEFCVRFTMTIRLKMAKKEGKYSKGQKKGNKQECDVDEVIEVKEH